ncbi:hypothetical protein [Streptomyces platensis]|uniref:hypothetical protein n=1 Tax=Streptomyces platensis TaxID=58346 RepID=UPI00386ED141|nr:hypothetical protein OG962_05220 [Streptomyces platensis]
MGRLSLTALPRVPSGDIRKVSTGSVLLAQIDADTRSYMSVYYKDEERRIRACAAKPGSRACPVRAPEYHDLTGDGKDELIVGVERENHFLFLYVYDCVCGTPCRRASEAHRRAQAPPLTCHEVDGSASQSRQVMSRPR